MVMENSNTLNQQGSGASNGGAGSSGANSDQQDIKYDISIPEADLERNKQYAEFVESKMPKSNHLRNLIMAFVVGGIICIIGQILYDLYGFIFSDQKEINAATVITLVFLGCFLTGLGIYDKITKHAGAGSIVPITGFANAMASPAIEFKREGLVFGLGAKLFLIGGAVVVNGVAASIVVALVRMVVRAIWGIG